MTLHERLATALEQLRRLEDEKVLLQVARTSQAQMQFVIWVGDHPGCRLQQVAAGLGLSAPTVSVGVQRLEQAGLLQRASDEHDQRAINLVVSPRGQELYMQVTDAREHRVKALLEKLKPNEQRQLVELLERCLGKSPSGSPTMPVEPLSIVTETKATVSASQEIESPEFPKQLDLFGG